MRLRTIIGCLLLTLSASPLCAQGNALRDSLFLRLASKPSGTDLLQTLHEITRQTIDTDLEQCKRYNDSLVSEAIRQQNSNYLCEAYYTQLVLAYNVYDITLLNNTADLLEPLARREKRYDLYFRSKRCRLDMQLIQTNYEHAEKELNNLLTEAEALDNKPGIIEVYQGMGNLYRLTFRQEQSIEVLEKARRLALKSKATHNVLSNIYQTLLFLYKETANYPKWLRTLRLFEAHLKSDPEKENLPSLMIVYTSYMDYYSELSDWKHTEHYRLLCEKIYDKTNSPLYNYFFDVLCANYFSARKNYEQALEKIDRAIVLMKAMDTGADYYNLILGKAELLTELNRPDEALALFKEVYTSKDNLYKATIDKQYAQIRKDFNTDKLLLEQAQLRHQMQRFTLLLLGLGLLSVLGAVVFLFRSSLFLKRAEREMREMTRQMEQAGEAKNRFLSNIGTAIHKPLNTVVEGSLRLAEGLHVTQKEKVQLSDNINRMASGLLEMINDILDLSRLEAGMMKFDLTDVEINSLILNAITEANTKNNFAIQHEIPENVLCMIRADNNRLLQVLQSLIISSIEQEEIRIRGNIEHSLFRIDIEGTVLAQENPTQEAIIRNEINRMLVAHFNGTYEILDKEGLRSIGITLPISGIIRADK